MWDFGLLYVTIGMFYKDVLSDAVYLALINPVLLFAIPVGVLVGSAIPRTVFTSWALFILWGLLMLWASGTATRPAREVEAALPFVHALIVLLAYSHGALIVWLCRPRTNIPFFSGPK